MGHEYYLKKKKRGSSKWYHKKSVPAFISLKIDHVLPVLILHDRDGANSLCIIKDAI